MADHAEPSTGSRATTHSPTWSSLLDEVERAVADQYPKLADLGRDGAIEAEGELRRAVVTMNGAGLLAVISLLSHSGHMVVLRAAALAYFAGLVAACLGWAQRAASSRRVALGATLFAAAIGNVRKHPIANQPLETASEIDAVGEATKRVIEGVSKHLKHPGKSAARWTYVALICFFTATAALLADFEMGLAPSGSTSLPRSGQTSIGQAW